MYSPYTNGSSDSPIIGTMYLKNGTNNRVSRFSTVRKLWMFKCDRISRFVKVIKNVSSRFLFVRIFAVNTEPYFFI